MPKLNSEKDCLYKDLKGVFSQRIAENYKQDREPRNPNKLPIPKTVNQVKANGKPGSQGLLLEKDKAEIRDPLPKKETSLTLQKLPDPAPLISPTPSERQTGSPSRPAYYEEAFSYFRKMLAIDGFS